MFKKPGLRFILLILVLFLSNSFATSQVFQTNQTKQARQPKQNQTADEQPRRIKAEPANAYSRWIKEDVSLIITESEREAFDKLKTNEEREEFIKIFWARRDLTRIQKRTNTASSITNESLMRMNTLVPASQAG